ncbi:DNA primase [Bordetella pseudohinzii]|uniref:DNA primase n=1 Tax=Bordetella pseudohinzii TaxID=1331258 RepID=A0A0M7HV13_9BORD|nr:DNA primase [Bordetella pseudohinzii]
MKVDLVALVGERVKLRRTGGKYVGKCPFHEDRKPSFQIDPAEGFYKCWGCGKTGDAVQWVRERFGTAFVEAVEQLARHAGIELPRAEVGQARESRKHLAPLYQALAEAQRIYWSGMAKSPMAGAFLREERGLKPEIIQKFELGAVGRGVLQLLRRPDQVLLAAGLAVQGEHGRVYDRFRNRVMFPIRNERGHLVSFAGRSLTKADHIPKYLNGPETELFHKERELYGLHLAKSEIRKQKRAVVVEGYFDVIQGHQAGDMCLVASMGTAISHSQVLRLLQLTDEIVFVFDGDGPGRKASLAAAKVFLAAMGDGKSARFAFLPDDHDPDSFLRCYGIIEWQSLLASALPLSQVLARYVSHGLDLAVPECQVVAAGKARECLNLIKDAPMYAKALSAHLERVTRIPLATEHTKWRAS